MVFSVTKAHPCRLAYVEHCLLPSHAKERDVTVETPRDWSRPHVPRVITSSAHIHTHNKYIKYINTSHTHTSSPCLCVYILQDLRTWPVTCGRCCCPDWTWTACTRPSYSAALRSSHSHYRVPPLHVYPGFHQTTDTDIYKKGNVKNRPDKILVCLKNNGMFNTHSPDGYQCSGVLLCWQ